MNLLSCLDAIADDYDALLCDVWGVIHDGRRAFSAAAAALTRARAAGKAVVLLTNVPKPRDPIPEQLDRIGVPRAAWDVVVTSGDAIRTELARRAPGPMLRIGPDTDGVLWEGLGLEFAELATARFVGISGFRARGETPADYADLLRRARAADLELLCANPDVQVRIGDELVWCAGAVARDYTALGGRVVMAGKPHAPIYELAYAELERLLGGSFARSRVLCIGDGIDTDVAGANAQGLDCLFVASGMHGDALLRGSAPDPDRVRAALAVNGRRAEHVIAALA